MTERALSSSLYTCSTVPSGGNNQDTVYFSLVSPCNGHTNTWITCKEFHFPFQARRKSEELKSELSDSSKRNSLVAESGSSKRSSLFSPEGSDGGESSRKVSLKSSAQAVRFLNKGRNMVSVGLKESNMAS